MTVLSATNTINSPELAGVQPVNEFTIYNAEIIYPGGMVAVDYTDEVQMAADTAGLRVIGQAMLKVDNTNDGEVLEAKDIRRSIVRYNNSSTYPVVRSAIGQNCYVEDDNIVAAFSTNLVPAGIIFDIDSDGVWVDQTPAALALARSRVPPVLVAKTDDYTLTAALAFEGRTAFNMSKNGGVTLTLPSAVAGYRFGVMRTTASATYDVNVQAATGDKVQGYDALSAASKKVENTVDAVSGIIWFEAADDTVWGIVGPIPADVTSWVKNDA